VAVNVQVVYFLQLSVDGTITTTFNESGRPYNVTANVTDSLGDPVDDATVRIVEQNGLNLFAPTQAWQEGSDNRSVVSYSISEVRTNSSGLVSFTLIPTGNKLIDVDPSIIDFTGNYSLTAELYVSGTLQRTVNLTLVNLTAVAPDAQVSSENQDNVDFIYDTIYQIFSTVKGWFTF
jgi:hypothetical protein